MPDDSHRPETANPQATGQTTEPAPDRQPADARHAANDGSGAFDATFVRIMSLLLLLLLLVKAYGVSRFSLTTGAALVTAAPLSVLIGTLALYEYAFVAALAAAAFWLFIVGILTNGELRRWTPLTFAIFLFATLLAPPQYLYWTFGAVIVSFALYRIIASSPRAKKIYARLTRSSGIPTPSRIAACIAALLAAGFVLFTLERPWLPAQVVALKHPIVVRTTGIRQHSEITSRPVVFIVSEQNNETTMLVDEDRYLVSIPTSDIAARAICHLEGQFGNGQPLLWVILGRSYSSPNLACWRLTDQPGECPPPSPSRGPCPGPPPAAIKPP
jgi:hypothetical protein